MRHLISKTSLALALALAGCDAKPPPGKSLPRSTIQHDQPQDMQAPERVPAPPLPEGADTAQLPPDHPRLGDGSQHQELPPGHPGAPQEPTAKELLAKVEAMKEQLKDKPKTIEITVALGSLYYDNGRYLDAIDYYRQAAAQGAGLVKSYREIQAADPGVKAAELKAAGCDRDTLRDSDPMMARAQELQKQGKKAEALACATEAVRPVVMAHQRRGNAFYLVGNPAEAVKEHERALELDPDNAESLFFRGAIIFDSQGDDVAQLELAQQSWKHFLAVAPDSPRAKAVKTMMPQLEKAIALGGVSKLPKPAGPEVADDGPMGGPPPMASGPAPLDPGAAQAIESTEITPELVQGFAKILDQATGQLAKGDVDGARTNIVRVFPFVMADLQKGPQGKIPPEVRARAQALMGVYMSTKGAPMAQSLLGMACGADPKAVDALGDALEAQGDAEHAKLLWTALTQQAPDYAQGAKVASKLR